MPALLVPNNQKGFSLVELILAMALFSFALLVIAIGFLALFRMYESGIEDRHTQLNARQALDKVVQTGRQANWFAYTSNVGAHGHNDVLCISGNTGGSSKMYYIDTFASPNALVEANWNPSQSCTAVPGVSITPSDVAISSFGVEPSYVFNGAISRPAQPCGAAGGCQNNPLQQVQTVRIDISAASLPVNLDATGQNCNKTGSLACSITTLSTTVTSRSTL